MTASVVRLAIQGDRESLFNGDKLPELAGNTSFG
jgi:hypothetical protein